MAAAIPGLRTLVAYRLRRHDCLISRILKIARQRSVDADSRIWLCRSQTAGPLVFMCTAMAGSTRSEPGAVLRATHEGALSYCSLADLKRFAVDLA